MQSGPTAGDHGRGAGFAGQRARVLPVPLVREALRSGPTSRLLVTDVGWYPRAARHSRSRPDGATGAVVLVCTAGSGWYRLGAPERATVPMSGSPSGDGAAPTTGATAGRLHPGQALVLPPSVPHAYGADTSDPWTIWWLHAEGADLPHLLPSPDSAAVVTIHDQPQAVAHVSRALTALERDQTPTSVTTAAAAGWSLLAQVHADHAAGPPSRHPSVTEAREHLRAHLDEPVVVGRLARRAGLSASHFAALFREDTGCGVLEYAKRLRMARAGELLLTTSWPVAEVARSVGYADPFYFSRQFRAVHGRPPSAVRAEGGLVPGAGADDIGDA